MSNLIAKSVRLPGDLVEYVNDYSDKNFSNNLIQIIRSFKEDMKARDKVVDSDSLVSEVAFWHVFVSDILQNKLNLYDFADDYYPYIKKYLGDDVISENVFDDFPFT